MGHDVVMAPCNGCYHNLKKAEYDLENDDADSKDVVEQHLQVKAGHKLRMKPVKVETIHALDWIKRMALAKRVIKDRGSRTRFRRT